MKFIGYQSLITIVCYLFFIFMSFWCIQDLHLERHLKMHEMQGKLLIVILSIVSGYLLSSFVLSLMDSLRDLIYIFKS
ncbi:hypothetical protein WR164_10530 [Philodulcilactobacillus myokoensis]|uniref:DUF1146 domain-containing protein n=1 Tax=Philodulcilactobacillus myokoensis TaxID=2929573 RepID=A0A9W6B155_9LACO|nr:DUF1146 family protein [Philodulcilactobacillus myokoensis]GLB47074.1 hypothetical protein WR164_10530 [Philodulcilactobacillus myokoensis]